MMATQVKDLPVFKATRDGLVGALSLAEQRFTAADFSYDPTSEYRRAHAVIDATLLQLRALAVEMLKSIDDAIAKGDLVTALTKSAQKAKKEADRVAHAAHQIDAIANVVGKITEVVTGIAKLPFL